MVYSLVVAIVGLLVVLSLLPLSSLVAATLLALVLVASGLFSAVQLRRAREYSFDQHGVYERGSLVIPWENVSRISLDLSNRSGSFSVAAPPSLMTVLSGPVVQEEEWTSYAVSVVFDLRGGSRKSVPSNLDKLTDGRVLEGLVETAKSVNPKIVFV